MEEFFVPMEMELRDYIRILRKRMWIIIAVVLVCSLAAGLYSKFMITPMYEAKTSLIVNRTAAAQIGTSQIDLNEINTNIRLIDTYKEIIRTPAIMDVVVDNYPELQMTAGELIKGIKVSSVANTQVMSLSYQHESYRKAAEIVNAITQTFKEQIPAIFNFQVENVSILNEAPLEPVTAPAPVNQNTMLNVALGFIVSLMVAVGISFLLEYLDDSIKSEADVLRYLELPTLAMIAKVDSQDLRSDEPVSKEREYVQKAGEVNHVQIGK